MSDCNNIQGGGLVVVSEPQLPYCEQCGSNDCVEIIDAQCVVYHSLNDKPTKLENLGMPNLSTAEAIFEAIDDLIGNGANIPITRINTDSVIITANGAANHTIKADVRLSEDAGNVIEIRDDGLFVSTTAGGFNQRFGVAGEDATATQHRTFNAADLYNITLNAAQFIVTGTYQSGQTIPSYLESQMFFNPRKAAFRAGQATLGQWDNGNVGPYSAAFGANTTASGDYAMAWGTANEASSTAATVWGNDNVASGSRSTAFGQSTTASGYTSTAWGEGTDASGHYSSATGFGTTSKSYAGFVVGTYNDSTAAALANAFDATNRAFQIGIGTSNVARVNAMTVLFNGNVGLYTTTPAELLSLGSAGVKKGVISFAGSTSGKVIVQPAAAAGTWTLTLPIDDGDAGEVLTTDGNGVTSWEAPSYSSGTYVPTIANESNVASSTSHGAQWLRVGDVVTVSGSVTIDATAASALSLTLTLPVAADFGNAFELAGSIVSGELAGLSGSAKADTTNDVAQIDFIAPDTSAHVYYYHFTYQIPDVA